MSMGSVKDAGNNGTARQKLMRQWIEAEAIELRVDSCVRFDICV